MLSALTCCVVRVEVAQEVALAAAVLVAEPVHHKVCALHPFQALDLGRHPPSRLPAYVPLNARRAIITEQTWLGPQ